MTAAASAVSAAAASAHRGQTLTDSVTSMLPRVALEYGHTWWALCIRSSASLARQAGQVADQVGVDAVAAVGVLAEATCAVMPEASSSATFSLRATSRSALRKQAA